MRKGLEDYYRNRNLLKAKVTAEHVANAVLFFVTAPDTDNRGLHSRGWRPARRYAAVVIGLPPKSAASGRASKLASG